ncbi:MAG TPA: extracellular solute-binding protein [Christensenellaceae bacterium]|nr:extracellular solute-binding protein [Christensenellaceae bacterium]
MKKFRHLSLFLAMLLMLSIVHVASAEVVEIDFWHSWGSGKNYEAVTTLVNEFNTKWEGKYHVTETFSGNYAEVLSKGVVAYSANENPTVSVVDACMSLNAKEYGIMTNLSEKAAADKNYDINQFMPGMLMFSTDAEGNVWSLPFARSTQIMYVNNDLIKSVMGEAKIPATWDDIFEICKVWKETHDAPGYSHPVGGGYYAWYVTTLGGEYMNAAGDAGCMYLNDGWEKALTMWRTAIDNGWYQVPSLSTAGYYEDFMAEKLPIMFTSTGSLTNILTNAEFDVGVGYLPGGLQEDGSILRSVSTGGANLMLYNNKSEAETEAGWEFIKHMTSTEANVYHNATTGYILSHIGADKLPQVQELWTKTPEFKVAYDQLQFVHESYVSKYTSEIDLEVVDTLNAFAMDNMTVEEGLEALKYTFENIMPNGITDTY